MQRLLLIKAVPGDKLVELEGQERPRGYYQRFGVTGSTEEEMLAVVRDWIDNDLGSRIIEVENQGEPDFEDLDADIRGLVGNVMAAGIWYVSGRAFYIKEDKARQSDSPDTRIN